jgi:hypothetical protein
MATVVLPIPPGPTMVSKRRLASCVAKAATVASRPMMRMSGVGRLSRTGAALGGEGPSGLRSSVTGVTKL